MALRNILSWIFGILLLLAGLPGLATQPLAGLLLIAAGVLLLPPVAGRLPRLKGVWRTVLVVVLVMAGFGGIASKGKNPIVQDTPAQEAGVVSSASPKIPFVFDVPSLIGKNVLQVKAVLGTPSKNEKGTGTANALVFLKNNQELDVEYDSATGNVSDLTLMTDDADKTKQHLLDVGNLADNDPQYALKFETVVDNPSSYADVVVMTPQAAQQAVAAAQKEKDSEQYFTQAKACAQQQVTSLLKAPSTAKFPWPDEIKIAYNGGTYKYAVQSYVDSQNGFGAMLRSNFLCSVVYDPASGSCNASCQMLP